MINVIVNGASGKMGQETVKAVMQDPALKLVGQLDHHDDLGSSIEKMQAHVVIDFTTPTAVFMNTMTIINANAHPVIGTTGLALSQIQALQDICATKGLGGIIAPNFSIGAILMMRFAQEAANYFNDVEIIELHHNGKKDAPSGTALKTAQMIAEKYEQLGKQPAEVGEETSLAGARGAKNCGIHIHSVRLPGLVAHQKVIFGGQGETLTIQHDSIDREAFMPGIILACKKVVSLDHLVYGLEKLL